jgi:O-antigen/teichoic acid export membrane protein
VFLPAAVVSLVVLLRRVRRSHPDGPVLARPDRALVRKVAGFGLPRTVSAVAEQANVWLPLILVGVLLDASAAGAYGAAGRFVAAGVVVSTAARIAVAPRFSALLARGETDSVAHLYAVTARWVLLFGSPIYVVLAVNAPTVLRWLGDGFDDATLSMVILCLCAALWLAAGNVQSLLLMSGGSARAAANTTIALLVMVVAVLVLVPLVGMEGAAVAWVIGALLDASLAVTQVRRRIGISLDLGPTVAVMGVVAVSVGGPCLLAVAVLGQGWTAFTIGVLGAGLGLLAVCWVGRRPLHVGELTSVFRRSEPVVVTEQAVQP